MHEAQNKMSAMLDHLADGINNGSLDTKDVSVDNLDPQTEFFEYSRQLREACDKGKIDKLTTQEIGLLTYIRMGLPIPHAVKASGMTRSRAAAFLESDPRAREATEYAAVLHTSAINVTAELLTMQAYEERARAGNATEGLKALEVIAKINQIGAYASAGTQKNGRLIDSQALELNNGSRRAKNRKQLEQMTDDKLLEDANLGYDSLEPEPVDYSQKSEVDFEHPFADDDDIEEAEINE